MPYVEKSSNRKMEREIKGDSLRITRKTRCSKRANEKHLNKYINYVYALCALRFISEWEGRCERGRELKLHTDTNWRTLVCVSCCFDTLLCDVVNFVFFFWCSRSGSAALFHILLYPPLSRSFAFEHFIGTGRRRRVGNSNTCLPVFYFPYPIRRLRSSWIFVFRC